MHRFGVDIKKESYNRPSQISGRSFFVRKGVPCGTPASDFLLISRNMVSILIAYTKNARKGKE